MPAIAPDTIKVVQDDVSGHTTRTSASGRGEENGEDTGTKQDRPKVVENRNVQNTTNNNRHSKRTNDSRGQHDAPRHPQRPKV